jgi:hypothetical protein
MRTYFQQTRTSRNIDSLQVYSDFNRALFHNICRIVVFLDNTSETKTVLEDFKLQKLKETAYNLISFLSGEVRILLLCYSNAEKYPDLESKRKSLILVEELISPCILDTLSLLTTSLFTLNYGEKCRDLMVDFVFYLVGDGQSLISPDIQQLRVKLIYEIATSTIWKASQSKLDKITREEDKIKFQGVFDHKFQQFFHVSAFRTFSTINLMNFKKELLDILDVYVDKLDHL